MCVSRARVVRVLLLVTCLTAVPVLQSLAVDTLRLSLGDVEGDGWSASDLELQLNWTGIARARTELTASSLRLPPQLGRVTQLHFTCDATDITPAAIACERGTLKLHSSKLGRQSVPVSFDYDHADTRLRVRMRGIRTAGGRVALAADYRDGQWSASIRGAGLVLAKVAKELQTAGVELPALELQGSMDLDLDLAGGPAGLSGARFDADIESESFTDATGRYAGEQVRATLSGKARPRRYGWEIESRLTARQGAVYIEPLYVEVADQPVVAELAVGWWSARRRLRLHSFNYRDPGTLQLAGKGVVETGHEQPVRELQLELQQAVFPVAYERYLQPWLAGTLAGNLEMAGGLHGRLQVTGGRLTGVSVDLQGVSVSQNDGLFGFESLTGELDWSDSTTPEYSTLAWDGGHVYRIDLGGSALEIESTGNSVRLMRPVQIPVLDGALDIEAFGLGYPAEGLHWEFDGILTPVSLQQMTRALGWPEFGGKLSGVIPSVRYDRGLLTVGGVLLVRVFDGVVTLRGLQITDPFGLVPRLQVDAKAENIDLETLTGTFSFGRIEGRLDGRVDGLLLESWRPVAFDAEFATPVGDKSRHRISQKAVDNISNIGGGGVGGALSRSFLQFLEDFPYARLGIRCRLENGVCDMGGVEPAESGYYLVKGRFLPPRLDVVGYASRVDWDSLVAQIIAVTREKGVVVE